LNAKVRYEIIPKAEDGSSMFDINPKTGQIETKVELSRFDFKVFGFDVRASDRDGEADGLSSIANVFVSISTLVRLFVIFLKLDENNNIIQIYVLNEEEEAVITLRADFETVENHLDIISRQDALITIEIYVRNVKLTFHNFQQFNGRYRN
jgi:hypothetical protein